MHFLLHILERHDRERDSSKQPKNLAPLFLGLFILCYLSLWILILIPWATWTTMKGWLLLGVSHMLAFIIVYNHYLASSTHPGTVPSEWLPPNATIEDLEKAYAEPKQSVRFRYHLRFRYCTKCKAFKPPRAHHCKGCKRCILRMDHHCVWLNQCVGYYNHKLFLTFLFYLNIGMLFCVALLLTRIVNAFIGVESMTVTHGVLSVVVLIGLVVVVSGTLVLFIQQLSLIARNLTSIELWLKHWATMDYSTPERTYRYPYDKGGYFANLQDFLGSNVFTWIVPTVPSGDGLSFPDLIPQESV